METETTIQGLSELDQALSDFPVLLQKKVLRGALRAGQKVFLDEAKAHVPVKSGALRDSLRISTRIRGAIVSATLTVGSKIAFYAHMVEFGTLAHFIKPKFAKALGFLGVFVEGVHNPGAQKKPFMRPALDTKQGQAVEAFAGYMRNRLEKESVKQLAAQADQTDQAAP